MRRHRRDGRECCVVAAGCALARRLLGAGPVWRVRFVAGAGALTVAAAVPALALGAALGLAPGAALVAQALGPFGAAIALAGVTALASLRAVFTRIAARDCDGIALAALLGLGLVLAALWLAAMHAGLWFAWRDARSPLPWGSEWFYAEVYFEYLRGGAGTPVAMAATAAILLPLPLLLAVAAARCLAAGAPPAVTND